MESKTYRVITHGMVKYDEGKPEGWEYKLSNKNGRIAHLNSEDAKQLHKDLGRVIEEVESVEK